MITRMNELVMTGWGWTFLALAWGSIALLTVFCYARVLGFLKRPSPPDRDPA